MNKRTRGSFELTSITPCCNRTTVLLATFSAEKEEFDVKCQWCGKWWSVQRRICTEKEGFRVDLLEWNTFPENLTS